MIQSGDKCVVAEKIAPNTFKKQKIRAVVTAHSKDFENFDCDTLSVQLPDGISCVGGGLFDSKIISEQMPKKCNRQITCEFVNGKIRSVVCLEKDEDVTSVTGTHLALSLKTAATELLYPFAADKTFIFRQKTN